MLQNLNVKATKQAYTPTDGFYLYKLRLLFKKAVGRCLPLQAHVP